MPNVYIRKAEEADLEIISDLAKEIWWQHYPGIISDEQIRYMLDKNYSLSALKQQMREGQEFHLLGIDGKALAFAGISGKRNDFFLHKLYSKSGEYRRLGSLLFNYLLLSYPKMQRLELRVNRNNAKAIAFYLRNGFKIVASDDLEIGSGFRMEDYLMENRISP
jgi:RimJ/RimL family protein N-acetyltransferase